MPFFLHGEVATWEIVIWENVHFGSCRLGSCSFWKLPLGKLSFGKLPLGKFLWEVAPIFSITMLLKHIYWEQIFAHIFTQGANFWFVYSSIWILQTGEWSRELFYSKLFSSMQIPHFSLLYTGNIHTCIRKINFCRKLWNSTQVNLCRFVQVCSEWSQQWTSVFSWLMLRAAVVHLNFRAGSTSPGPSLYCTSLHEQS